MWVETLPLEFVMVAEIRTLHKTIHPLQLFTAAHSVKPLGILLMTDPKESGKLTTTPVTYLVLGIRESAPIINDL